MHFSSFLVSLSYKAHKLLKLYSAFDLQLLRYLVITDNFVKIKQNAIQSKELQDVKGMQSKKKFSPNTGRGFDYM